MMKLATVSVLSTLTLLAACAHKPMQEATNLSVKETISINASADAVWAKSNNFGDLGAWHPAVAKTAIVGGTNNQTGAVRLLTLQDGGTINETLTAYDAGNKTLSYVINESVLPVSSYSSTFMVKPVTAKTSEVIWTAKFNSKEGQTDETASKTITSVFQGGLANLKKITE